LAADKRKILEAARKHAQKGAKEKALKEFGKLLKLDPRDSKVRLEMGDTYRRWGQVSEAIEAYSVVADQFMHEGFDARAVAVFKQIQNLQPDTFAFHEPLAELYQRMGLTAEAIGSLESAAESYRAAGQKQEALGLLRKMAAIDPSNTTSRIKVADLLQQEGMKADAISEYDAVVAELELQGDTESVGKLFERILEIQPDRVETLALYARNLISAGSAPRAESLAKRALQLDRSPENFELLADVYRMDHRDEELVALYRELAELYRERGDEDRTREILQRYVPLDSIGSVDTPNGYIDEDENLVEDESIDDLSVGDETTLLDGDLLSDSSLLISDDDSGLGVLSQSDDLDPFGADDLDLITDSNEMTTLLPDDPPAGASQGGSGKTIEKVDASQLMAEASVYLRYGKRGQAIANLESILEQDPNHRPALEKLGEAFVEGDEAAKAVAMWIRAAKLAAESGEADAAALLRNRIAALDSAAAEALDLSIAREPDSGEQRIAGDLIDDTGDDPSLSGDRGAGSPDGDSASLDDAELPELDLAEVSVRGMDIEIDIDAASFSHETLDEPSLTDSEAAANADVDPDEISIDDLLNVGDVLESGEIEIDDEFAASGAAEVAEEAGGDGIADRGEIDPEEIDSEALTMDGSGGAAMTPERIAEELEEADFYMEQGLLDEAEAVYARILSSVPNHPHAMLRLGELNAQRGDTTGAAAPSTDSADGGVESEASFSEESLASDIGADLAGWEDDMPALGAQDVEEPSDEADAGDLVLEDPSEFADAEREEEIAGEELVASESDLVAELGLDDSSDASLGSEAAAGATAEADEQDETGAFSGAAVGSDAPDTLDDAEESDALAASETPLGATPEALAGEGGSVDHGDPLGFDLAAELSQSFDRDPDATGSGASGSGGRGDTSEDGFAAVFAEFKKGVSETLTAGDHQAHYDLGIAYREMGLLGDAITELRLAMNDPERRIGCLHLMGMCANEMGEPEQAIGHFTEALASDGVEGDTMLALKLDLGTAHQAVGDIGAARRAYEEIHAVDPGFADVASRLDELEKHDDDVPEEDGGQVTEEYETFAEFLGDFDAPDAGDAGASIAPNADAEEAPAWESFDDVVAEVAAEDSAASASHETDTAASAESSSGPEYPEPAAETEKTPKRRKKISFV